VLLAKAWLLVDVLLLLAVPLAAFGAYRFLLRLTDSRPMSLWGAVAYGVLPVVTGAVQEGRLGTVVGTVVLPWLAAAALFLGPGHPPDRRHRAAWRSALWLAVLTAFVPLAWPMAVILTVLAGVLVVRGAGVRAVVPLAIPLVAALVLLLPWTWASWDHGGLSGWVFEAGLPAPRLTEALSRWDVLLGRPGHGAPAWLSAGVLVAALVALLRADTRPVVLKAWAVLVVALASTAALASRTWPGGTSSDAQVLWLGFPLVVAQAAAITAAAAAGTGIRRRLAGSSFGWRQPLGVVVVALAALSPIVSVGWWVVSGSGGPLDRQRPTDVPTYMTDAAAADPVEGVLVVDGSRSRGFTYVLLRQAGLRLGDDSVLPSDAEQSRLSGYVESLVTDPEPDDVAGLSRLGVRYVYAPAPADISLAGNLDSVSGMTPGSASRRGSRAWQLEAAASEADLRRRPAELRPWLLAGQGLALLVVVVLAAPSRKGRR
jgi:hypothetical protein